MSTVKFEAAPLPALTQSSTEGPRKKRKRAPAQGAADDCFTCLNHKIRCDRRRPYCSQCLDGGQDCAGYKTQLTWGVGVASRGKLRGLSLPIAGTTKVSNDTIIPSPKAKKRLSTSASKAASNGHKTASSGLKSSTKSPPQHNNSTVVAPEPQATYPVPHSSAHDGRQRNLQNGIDQTNHEFHQNHFSIDVSQPTGYHPIHNATTLATTFPDGTTLPPVHNKGFYVQSSSYLTPSPTIQHFQVSPPQYQFPSVQPQVRHIISNPQVQPQSSYSFVQQNFQGDQREYADSTAHFALLPTNDLVSPRSNTLESEDDIEEVDRNISNTSTYPDTLSSAMPSGAVDSDFLIPLSGISGVGKTQRMQYLIQYYAEVISPVIVAFDSPSNPLRNQILGLATRSESLQHAISALSASNIRQRRESGALSTGKTSSARRSSYMHLELIKDAWDEPPIFTLQDRKREESQHKNIAVHMLNQQLANPVLRKDDSVLATLLMLCLFHICDSGIARFQTQFAGVKKLLALRGHDSNGSQGDTKWMTRIFALFDSVAATVNDREGQIDGPFVDMCAQADGEWPYETLSGIDSRLFKPMSRLGRLNILSQGKSVEFYNHIVTRPLPQMSHMNYHGFGYAENGTYDGNGWMRIASDDDLYNLKTASVHAQEQFWREWLDVRQELQMWMFDSTRFDGSNPSQIYLTPEQRMDMCHISESFRYSCLLYTERLADPQVPSTDSKIQGWVQKSLEHIKQVRSDVYLLWPLFITGAECGHEHERNIIRERCLDIQKDSGFMNNSSCLTLLEKVWRGDSIADRIPGQQQQPLQTPSTFRFRDIMLAEGNDGEWIVV